MALFFNNRDELKCDKCNSSLFKEQELYRYEEKAGVLLRIPAKILIVCSNCGKILRDVEANGHVSIKNK